MQQRLAAVVDDALLEGFCKAAWKRALGEEGAPLPLVCHVPSRRSLGAWGREAGRDRPDVISTLQGHRHSQAGLPPCPGGFIHGWRPLQLDQTSPCSHGRAGRAAGARVLAGHRGGVTPEGHNDEGWQQADGKLGSYPGKSTDA